MKSCDCEDRPCCGCGQEYLDSIRDNEFDDSDAVDFVDRLMVDSNFYDRVVGW